MRATKFVFNYKCDILFGLHCVCVFNQQMTEISLLARWQLLIGSWKTEEGQSTFKFEPTLANQ